MGDDNSTKCDVCGNPFIDTTGKTPEEMKMASAVEPDEESIKALIMSLSLLVIIHEGGHFLFARLFKVRVEKFCLFFDPWSLFSSSNQRRVIQNMP